MPKSVSPLHRSAVKKDTQRSNVPKEFIAQLENLEISEGKISDIITSSELYSDGTRLSPCPCRTAKRTERASQGGSGSGKTGKARLHRHRAATPEVFRAVCPELVAVSSPGSRGIPVERDCARTFTGVSLYGGTRENEGT